MTPREFVEECWNIAWHPDRVTDQMRGVRWLFWFAASIALIQFLVNRFGCFLDPL
jgi:hypothetical protein